MKGQKNSQVLLNLQRNLMIRRKNMKTKMRKRMILKRVVPPPQEMNPKRKSPNATELQLQKEAAAAVQGKKMTEEHRAAELLLLIIPIHPDEMTGDLTGKS